MGNQHSSEKDRDPYDHAGKTGRLLLAGAKLGAVPAQVWLLQDLRMLDLSHNHLPMLTSQIGTLQKLKTLKLSYNSLTSLPVEIYHLKELRTLVVDHNKLSDLSAVLPTENLKDIDLSFNEFTGEVGHPTLAIPKSAVTVNLSNNKITKLGEAFGFEILVHVEELNLDNNTIEVLPEEMRFMKRLTCLKIRNNKLASIPSAVLKETRLNRMHLEGNLITLERFQDTDGFEDFMERRRLRIEREIDGGLHTSRNVCGLEEQI